LSQLTGLVALTRARGERRHAELGQQTDPRNLVEPPGRRCGCWPTSPFLFLFFAESVRGAIGGTMMMMMRPPSRRRRTMELRRWTAISYGVIDNRSENLQHCQWVGASIR